MAGSRDAAEELHCELCGAADDRLQPIAGTALCAGCRRGPMDAALQRWGLREEHRTFPVPAGGTRGQIFAVEVRWPTAVELRTRLGAEGFVSRAMAFFGAGDPEVGVPDFDDTVLIEPDDDTEATVMALLEREPVRLAVLDLLALGCTAELVTTSLTVRARSDRQPAELPDEQTVVMLAVILAAHVERFARERAG